MGINPGIKVEIEDGSDYDIIRCDQIKILANGDVALRVIETPDGRFAGRITIS